MYNNYKVIRDSTHSFEGTVHIGKDETYCIIPRLAWFLSDATLFVSTGACIISCSGLRDGNYQSCRGCDIYERCTGADNPEIQSCESGKVWDNKRGGCTTRSSTCKLKFGK